MGIIHIVLFTFKDDTEPKTVQDVEYGRCENIHSFLIMFIDMPAYALFERPMRTSYNQQDLH